MAPAKGRYQQSETLPVGILLALSGGYMDAYTYLFRDHVFANAQTGNLVLFAVNLSEGRLLDCLRYLVPVLAFGAGVFLAQAVRLRFPNRPQVHWRQAALVVELLILFSVGFLPVEVNLLANSLVSLACGIQVQSFRKVWGKGLATTMCIGNFRSGTECLYRWRKTRDRGFLHRAKVYYVVILVFVLGAALGGLACRAWGRYAILICCPLLLASVGLMAWIRRSGKASAGPRR